MQFVVNDLTVDANYNPFRSNLQGRSRPFSARVLTQVGEAFRLDPHLAGDAPLSGSGLHYQMVFPKCCFHLFELVGIDWPGAVNHEEPSR
jgi:hypothetical protein